MLGASSPASGSRSRSIVRSTLRASLTILGILIGVAAVVTVTALGAGARDQVSDPDPEHGVERDRRRAAERGGLRARRARSAPGARLTEDDGRAIVREAVSVTAVAPALRSRAQFVAGERELVGAGHRLDALVLPRAQLARQRAARSGTSTTRRRRRRSCVLGSTVATKLFGDRRIPVGRTVRIGRHTCRVVGVLESKGEAPFGGDQDNMVLMPIGTMRGRIMRTAPGFAGVLLVSATSAETTQRAVEQIEIILRQRHRIEDDREPDFWIRTQQEFQADADGDLLAAHGAARVHRRGEPRSSAASAS